MVGTDRFHCSRYWVTVKFTLHIISKLWLITASSSGVFGVFLLHLWRFILIIFIIALELVHVNKRDPSCVALDKLVKISDTSENIWYTWLHHCGNIWYMWYYLIQVMMSMQCLITLRTHMGVPPWNICKRYCGINNSSSVLSRSYHSYLCI